MIRGRKMKKRIIFCSILVIFILIILPSVSSIEFIAVVETNKSNIYNGLKEINSIDIFKEGLKKITVNIIEKMQNINVSLIGLMLVIVGAMIAIIGKLTHNVFPGLVGTLFLYFCRSITVIFVGIATVIELINFRN